MNYKKGTQTRGYMKSVMRYVSQTSKTLWDGQQLVSGIGCQPETAFDEFLSTGTYTPFTLLVLRQAGGWGWGIFAFVWLSAIAGFILSFKKLKEHSNLETCCYVAMGASILVAMKPLMDHLALLNATPAFWWLIGGGVSYITGAVFYSLRKPYMHATFHLFCLGGSIGHIIAIWLIL